MADAPVRLSIRVTPGASRTRVGGSRGDALVVAVGARAVDGAATEAALAAVAEAFGLRRRDVSLVAGARGRSKVVALAGDPAAVARRAEELRGGADTSSSAAPNG